MRMDWDLDNISLMGLSRWFSPLTFEVEIEGGAFSRLRFEPDAAAMTFNDLLHEGEPDASAGFLPVGRVVEPLKNPEDLIIELGFDTEAIVLDVENVPFLA